MLVFLIGVGVGMVVAWNVVKVQPKWLEDFYNNVTNMIRS